VKAGWRLIWLNLVSQQRHSTLLAKATGLGNHVRPPILNVCSARH
jgi:hypothetical protein